MNRKEVVLVIYGTLGLVSSFGAIDFYVHNKLSNRWRVPRFLEAPAAITYACVAGAVWPVSIPVQIVFERKWEHD